MPAAKLKDALSKAFLNIVTLFVGHSVFHRPMRNWQSRLILWSAKGREERHILSSPDAVTSVVGPKRRIYNVYIRALLE
jgi:hypothetical protein